MTLYYFLCVTLVILSLLDYLLLPEREKELNPILRRFYAHARWVKIGTIVIFVILSFHLPPESQNQVVAIVVAAYAYAVFLSLLLRIR